MYTMFQSAYGCLSLACTLCLYIAVLVATFGCNNFVQTDEQSEVAPMLKELTDIDDLKVLHEPQVPREVSASDFNKAAMLSALNRQKFNSSKDRPSGLAEWRIVAYSFGAEVFYLDLYGGRGELAHDPINNRYFYWDYWKVFEQEMIDNKSPFARYVLPSK